MRTVSLIWSGPLPIREIAAPSPPPEAHGVGVYIWTVRVQSEWWAYYVGLTGKTFAERHREHLRLYHEGQYQIYDPDPFALGRKVRLWDGAYGWNNRHKIPEFQRRYSDLAPVIERLIDLFHVFLVQVDEARPRERLEAALSHILRRAPGGAAQFQDKIRYTPCRSGEEPLTFTLRPLPIVGLSDLGEICLPLAGQQMEVWDDAPSLTTSAPTRTVQPQRR